MSLKNALILSATTLCGSLLAMTSVAQTLNIDPSKGADPRVDYRSLTRYGEWDDRNYQLTAEDLKLLSPNEEELTNKIPAFFRVEFRREYPNYPRSGPLQYPRSVRQLFRIRYGGLIQNGKKIGRHRGDEEESRVAVPVNGEIKLNDVLGANEVTVEINPVMPDRVIAGANASGGQQMYFSADGGVTWSISGVLPSTCCDPTVGWSFDGTIAYAAALSSNIGINFYRSTDFGEAWSAAKVLTPGGSDKEFLHVDISPTSSFRDNVYLTWHDGNVLQFARSIDLGLNFTIKAFPSAPRGIGSDITTDLAGNIYYFYAAINTRQIILLKSTDGGDTFEDPLVVSSTNGSFDWPIPSMETRNAWIYAAADADRSAGPFSGSIYVAWTDSDAPDIDFPEDDDWSVNHTFVTVAYSQDGGVTWNKSFPQPTDDINTVDRWNQWITVDPQGVVHVVYYDTRNSLNRTGVDLYYTFSLDGAVTWNPPERISSQTSANLSDGQEFGDYNGISVILGKVIPAWTDNREGPPDSKDVYAADVVNVATEPTFFLQVDSSISNVCAPDDVEDITIQVASIFEFSNEVSLSLGALPQGFSGALVPTALTPPGQTVLSLSVDASATLGDHEIVVTGSAADTDDREVRFIVNVQAGAPTAPVLLSPPNAEPNAGASNVKLRWAAVTGALEYRVQVSTSSGFGSTFIDTTTGETKFLATGLTQGLTYFWRIASVGVCGQGPFSNFRSFIAISPLILLVDDDGNAPDLQSFYTDTLSALGVTFGVFDVVAEGRAPVLADFSGHILVVWYTGFRYTPISFGDGSELATYIDNGGILFLSSQDYLFHNDPVVPTFASDYLGVQSFVNDSNYPEITTSVIPSPGSIFDGLGTIALSFPSGVTDFTDSLVPNAAASSALQLLDGTTVALQTDNTVFFAFPFEAIANNGSTSKTTSADAQAVINAILEAFNPGVQITGQSPLSTPEEAPFTIVLSDLVVNDPEENFPTGFSLDVQGGANYSVSVTTVTPSEDFDGILSVPVSVTDGQEVSNVFSLTIDVLPINDPPLITGQNPVTMNENTSRTITSADLIIDDPDTNIGSLTLTVQNGANYTHIGPTITPATEFNGALSVPISVNDGEFASNIFALEVAVSEVNDPPVITGQAIALSTLEDQPLTITLDAVTVTDVDSDFPTGFSLSVLGGANYTLSENIVTPAKNFNGTLDVGVTVSDGGAKATSAPFSLEVTVAPVNDPPLITGQNPVVINENTSRTLTVADLVIDDPDTAVNEITLTVQDGENYTHIGPTITPITEFNGTLSIVVSVNDGEFESTIFSVEITVLEVNDPPLITGQNLVAMNENTSRTLTVADLMIDDPDTAVNEISMTVQDGANYTRIGPTITPTTEFNGTLSVPVSVDDGEFESNTFTLEVTVLQVNDPPLITGQNPVVINENTSRTLTVADLMIDDPDTAVNEIYVTVQNGANYTHIGPTITPTGDFTGTLSVPVSVNDGELESNTFTMKVTVVRGPCAAPPAPENLLATQGAPGAPVQISWDAVTVASSYVIHRNTVGDFSTAESIGATSIASWADPVASDSGMNCMGSGDGLRFYWVTSKNSCGESEPSVERPIQTTKNSGAMTHRSTARAQWGGDPLMMLTLMAALGIFHRRRRSG